MKKIAIIIAGGVGARMGQDIPKQFLTIQDKPVIIHTLEAFEKHPDIDHIIVACLAGWHDILKSYAKQFNISKLSSIVNGGEDGQASIKAGLDEAKHLYSGEDIVLIHDGNRPMVSDEIISDNIATCTNYGNAITVIPCTEVILQTDDHQVSSGLLDRDKLVRTQTPQAFYLDDILSAHAEAAEKKLPRTAASCALYEMLGRKLFFSNGSEKNLKLTTPDDIDIFEALLNIKRKTWLK